MRHSFGGMVAAVLIAAAPAAAQTLSPPGPWVVDIRGVTSPVPTDQAFYPPLASAFVPSRGFGFDVGGHVYLFTLGPARVGFGAAFVSTRSAVTAPVTVDEETGATSPGQRLTLTMRTIAPQVSFNFGGADGWSYLSAGLGTSSVTSEAEDALPGRHESGRVRAVNVGGGARWFIKPRVAFGFDLRAYRLAAGDSTPQTSVFAVGAGLSFR